MTRFDSPLDRVGSPLARAVLRTALYASILGAAWAVRHFTAAAPPTFVYQNF